VTRTPLRRAAIAVVLCLIACAPRGARADDAAAPAPGALEHLVPALANSPYKLESGTRPFLHRLAVTPGYGQLGAERLFALRIAYNPNDWLGYEATLAHNPGEAVHAVLHGLNAIARYPLPGRFQPYLTGGYGMITVHPGRSINADPVSKNLLTYGGGLEFYIRGDLAIRGDLQHAIVFGKERDRDGVVAYDYLQQTIGLSFYRSIGP
jgi:opacity protein-like surface antigen